jgi:HK97 family phage portal protein
LAGPGIRRRIGAALDVFRHGYPAARIVPPAEGRKAAVLGWPTLGDARPEWHLIDYATYVEEGVNMNAVIYAAVRYKWQAVAAAPLRAYKGDRDHPEPLDADHPLAKLVERPNPYQDWRTLQGQADAFLNVSGNAYFWLDRGKRGKGLPQAVYCPRPDRVFVVPDRHAKDGRPALLGYLYVPEGRPWGSGTPVLPQDMMHVKLFNPLDALSGLGEGLSPLSAGAYSTDVDNQITKFLKLFFERGGVPPYWFTFDEPLDELTFDRLREQIGEVYGGTGGWIKPGVLDRGGDVKRVAFTFQEMGFEVIDERNESRILGPLGVPPILTGTRVGLQRSTFANYGEARRAFWEDTMMPEMGLFEGEFRYYLRGDDGEFVAYDFSRVPALQKDVPKLTDAAYRLWSMGVPANDAFETVGLSVPDVPGGDTSYLPISVLPVAAQAPEEHTEEGAAEAEADARKSAPTPKKARAR